MYLLTVSLSRFLELKYHYYFSYTFTDDSINMEYIGQNLLEWKLSRWKPRYVGTRCILNIWLYQGNAKNFINPSWKFKNVTFTVQCLNSGLLTAAMLLNAAYNTIETWSGLLLKEKTLVEPILICLFDPFFPFFWVHSMFLEWWNTRKSLSNIW